MILKAQPKWMRHDIIPKHLLYGNLSKRKRKHGRSLKLLKRLHQGQHHPCWNSSQAASKVCIESNWMAYLDAWSNTEIYAKPILGAHAKRKAAGETPKPTGKFLSPHDKYLCCFHIGLYSYLQVHPMHIDVIACKIAFFILAESHCWCKSFLLFFFW